MAQEHVVIQPRLLMPPSWRQSRDLEKRSNSDPAPELTRASDGSDIDVVARMGTQVVYIQAKSTARAFASGKGKAALFDKDYKEWLKVAKKTTSEWNEIAEQSDESARRIWAYSGDIALPQKMVDHIRKLGGFVEKIDWGA